MTKLPLKQDFLNMYLWHGFETRPGQVIGSRVRWVDPGQPKKRKLQIIIQLSEPYRKG